MPELPEVHTTVTILHKLVRGRIIKDVWTDYDSPYYYGKENIKDPKYFKFFRSKIRGAKIIKIERRAKNVLIKLSTDQIILIHMKMTGQLLYGKYEKSQRNTRSGKSGRWSQDTAKKNGATENFGWVATEGDLKNPFSRFIHLVFTLDNEKHIAFSDMRKFGTIKLVSSKEDLKKEFEKIGPEPLEKTFDFKKFDHQINLKKTGAIKTVLMNSEIISGIGNIYSDEILFESKVLPTRKVSSLSLAEKKAIFKNTKKILAKGIDFGGDSMSDYRNPYGKKGEFQLHHQVYGRKNQPCKKRGCIAKIERKIIDGRSAHFCSKCQK